MQSRFSKLVGYAFVVAGCLLLAAMGRLELLVLAVPAAAIFALGMVHRAAGQTRVTQSIKYKV